MSENKKDTEQSFIKKLLNDPKFKELFWYIFFGVLTTIVAWGAYAILALVFNDFYISFDPSITKEAALAELSEKKVFVIGDGFVAISKVIPANIISWVCGVLFAFVTNKLWVFNSRSWKPGLVFAELGKFVLARLITGVIEWFGHPLLISLGLNQTINVFGKELEGFWAKIVISVIVVILNYVFSKLMVFKNKDKGEPKELTPEESYDEAAKEVDDALSKIRGYK